MVAVDAGKSGGGGAYFLVLDERINYPDTPSRSRFELALNRFN